MKKHYTNQGLEPAALVIRKPEKESVLIEKLRSAGEFNSYSYFTTLENLRENLELNAERNGDGEKTLEELVEVTRRYWI